MRVHFAGSGDAFGSGGRWQTCIHVSGEGQVLLVDCGATSLVALKAQGLNPDAVDAVAVTHLHGDHLGGLPFLILDGQSPAGPLRCGWLADRASGHAWPRRWRYVPRLQPGVGQFPVQVTELRTNGTPAVLGAAAVHDGRSGAACGAPPLALRDYLGSVTSPTPGIRSGPRH